MLAVCFSYKPFTRLRKILSIFGFSRVFITNRCWIWGPFFLFCQEILLLATLVLTHCYYCWRLGIIEWWSVNGVMFSELLTKPLSLRVQCASVRRVFTSRSSKDSVFSYHLLPFLAMMLLACFPGILSLLAKLFYSLEYMGRLVWGCYW